MHSYSNFNWKSADHVLALGLSVADQLLVAGPLYHVGAFDLAVPKQLIVRTDLPRNPSGKVLKRVLREEISRDLQAPES
jgi:acyl-coenzyme A synthetase/AMP-(fatty) acid ligase